VEVGESPIEGAMREVEEESGLQLEPSGIFSVEYKISKRSGKAWIRYGITGQIVGGSLKTPDRVLTTNNQQPTRTRTTARHTPHDTPHDTPHTA
jgi:8-oxo-dGTP pyrophosphatase MutT (NUDIX family)